MIELIQQKSGIIGNASAIAELAKKESAEILVLSDSHGRSEILRNIIEHFGPRCDAVAFCGDGIGDLCSALELTGKSKKFAACFPPVAVFARGNGDYPDFPFGQGYIQVPQHETLKAAGMNILLTHGHAEGAYYGLERLSQAARENEADIVFYGHTHIAARHELDCSYFINPGSCAHPRGGQPHSFAIVQVPGGQERAETTFFSIRSSLNSPFEFMPYIPEPFY